MTGRPLCECHGEPMRANSRHKGKVYWICAIRKRELTNKAMKAYTRSEKGKATYRRYWQSEKGREAKRRFDATPHRRLQRTLADMLRVRVYY